MTKAELAEQLRQRQREKNILPPASLAAMGRLDDHTIIDYYVTCVECGAKQAEGEELERIIAESHCADDFFDRCNATANGRAHTFTHHDWPEEIDAEEADDAHER
jgi:hypothetical protein